jgi:hypothetical protein
VPPPIAPEVEFIDSGYFSIRHTAGKGYGKLDEYCYELNKRSSKMADTSNQHEPVPSSAQSTDRSCNPTCLAKSQLLEALEILLKYHPSMKQYIKYKLPLERKDTGQMEVPISPIFYRDSYEICLDHGDPCIVEQGASSSKCTACTRFGGRCIFASLESGTPQKTENHFNCGRCAMNIVHPSVQHLSPVKLGFPPSRLLEQKDRRELLIQSRLIYVRETQVRLGELEQ